jgi:hypothetical protein
MCHIRLPDALAALIRESIVQDSTESPADHDPQDQETRVAELVRESVS